MQHAAWMLFVKRMLDILLSLMGMVFLSPLLLLLSVLILCESGRPVLFRQERIGKNGKLFLVCKFRTMRQDAPNVSKALFVQSDDYITKTGRFIRGNSLDELPQLFNILRGEMSVVGPRPLIPQEEEIHRLREIYQVYSVKPGITGLAQVNGRDTLSDEEKALYDKQYVEKLSLFGDVKILLKTVGVVLKRSDMVEGSEHKPD